VYCFPDLFSVHALYFIVLVPSSLDQLISANMHAAACPCALLSEKRAQQKQGVKLFGV